MWRRCGAVWLASGGDATLVDGQGEEEDDDSNDGDDEPDKHLKRNLRSALNVVVACFRRG